MNPAVKRCVKDRPLVPPDIAFSADHDIGDLQGLLMHRAAVQLLEGDLSAIEEATTTLQR